MGIDIGHSNGRARIQTRRRGHFGRQPARPVTKLGKVTAHLGVNHIGEIRVQRREVVAAGIMAILDHGLIAGGAGIAGFIARQLPDDPVGRFQQPVGLPGKPQALPAESAALC